MSNAMVNIYVRLVRSGARTIEEVPEKYREAVRAIVYPPQTNENSEENEDNESDEE